MSTNFNNDFATGFVVTDGFMAPGSKLVVLTNTTGTTLTATQMAVGAIFAQINLNGTLSAGANLQFATAANIISAFTPDGGAPLIGAAYRLKIVNHSSANHVWTTTTNTGVTLVGDQTIAQNAARDYQVLITSASTVRITSLGTASYTA